MPVIDTVGLRLGIDIGRSDKHCSGINAAAKQSAGFATKNTRSYTFGGISRFKFGEGHDCA